MSVPQVTAETHDAINRRLAARRSTLTQKRPRRLTALDRACRRIVLSRLKECVEPLDIVDADGCHRTGVRRPGHESDSNATRPVVRIINPISYRRFVLGGSLGAAESFLCGDWECNDLLRVMQAFSTQPSSLTRLERGTSSLLRYWRQGWNRMRRNSRNGSRRNIAAHYDLSNEFFEELLGGSMMYSSGVFSRREDSLEQAMFEKSDRICRRLALKPGDRVLEVGCGWGGFAIHAARNYGCHVTATTISQAQFDYAREQIRAQGLEDRIDLLLTDYRDLDGQYDKLVSIEMIEAVGEKYLDQYFAKCSDLLRPDGMMMLQSILIPDDRFDHYRNSVDFIRRYIFPGGFLPSFSAIGQSLRRVTDFRIARVEDFGLHYAETLRHWRERFWNRLSMIHELGFDDRFVRAWHYYLCYCEAGFRERQIGVSQLHFLKPGNRSLVAGIPMQAD